MKTIIITVAIIFTVLAGALAQCPLEPFTSQAQIDDFPVDFPDCTTIEELVIFGTDIVDLSPLSQITFINSRLSISNTSLTNLNGLSNLTINSDPFLDGTPPLVIANNLLLTSIEGLSGASGTIIAISIIDNPLLSSLVGLEGFQIQETEAEDGCTCTQIVNNDSLLTLEGFGGPHILTNIRISDNDNLLNLNGFNASQIDGGNIGASLINGLTIDNNSSLETLGNMSAFFTQTTILRITNNPNLSTLGNATLNWQESAGNIEITITNNENLTTCDNDDLCFRLAGPDNNNNTEINIFGNTAGCDSIDEVAVGCGCPFEDITFSSQQEIDDFPGAFPNCGIMYNDITIEGNDITDLNPLSGIIQINKLVIKNNPQLTSLAAFNDVVVVKELRIVNNDLLTTLDLLIEPSQEENIDIILNSNAQLSDINTLESLPFDKIGFLRIKNHPLLSQCSLASICNFLEQATTSDFDIDNNSTTCETASAILDNCNASLGQITGTIIFDFDANDCTPEDPVAPHLEVSITGANNTYTTFANESGLFETFVALDDTYTVALEEVPSYFVATPPTTNLVFDDIPTIQEVVFCITASEDVNDVRVTLIPQEIARPGFDSSYKLIYENLGSTTLSGDITLTFDDARQSFVSASPSNDNENINTVTWLYDNLLPFQISEIDLTMYNFEPPVNESGDLLAFTAIIEPVAGDVSPENNTSVLNQIMVNSFDPNDKLVHQGSQILEEQVGDYLQYTVRFQNVGTASAVNVRVEDVLTDNLDWSTFRMISASHDYSLTVENENELTWRFDNIFLPAQQDDDLGSNGYVTFEIRSLSTLQLEDVITNQAEIYFDFNPPIITNIAETEVVQSILDISEITTNPLKVFPNPTKGELTINSTNGNKITKVHLYDLLGKVVNTYDLTISRQNTSFTIDVSNLETGMYFLDIVLDNTIRVHKKLIKQ